MARYMKRTATRKSTSTLRDALMRELEQEARTIMRGLTEQFTRDLEKQGSDILNGLLSAGKTGGDASIGSSFGNVLSGVATYFLQKPRTSANTRESARSTESLRLSRSQALAEANAELARAERNS